MERPVYRLASRPIQGARPIRTRLGGGRLGLALATVLLWLLATTPPPVAAHPLGNFSVNRYSRLELSDDRLSILYVLDMAEIPTFQEMATIDSDRDGRVSDTEATRYATTRATAIAGALHLTLDGRPTSLTASQPLLTFPAGQAGLTTLRLEMTLTAALPAGQEVSIDYRDLNEPERLGWREIVAQAGAGRGLGESTVATVDRSDALRRYPDSDLTSPLNIRQARVIATVASTTQPGEGQLGLETVGRARDQLAELLAAETISLPVMMAALLIAFGLGAVHALSPGHGKTVVAAYLIGSRGTARHALVLGLTVTITHTLGVFALGLVTLFLAQYILPERLYPWLGATAGLLVVVIGLGLVVSRGRHLLGSRMLQLNGLARRSRLVPSIGGAATVMVGHGTTLQRLTTEQHHHAPADNHYGCDDHTHSHGDHHHSHGDHHHSHGLNHHDHDHHLGFGDHHHGPGGHTHLPPGANGEKVTWRSLLALGVSGGLLPCPSALVVLLSAIALHRVGFGLLLIVAFSAGLAAVLTGIGLLLVYAARLFARLPIEGRLMRILPFGSAVLVTLAGLAITAQALAEAGLLR